MDRAIKHHFNKDIKEKVKLPYGWKETWLLVLSDNQKVVFRACDNYAYRFEREKFFYENINKELGKICPEVYVVNGMCEYYDKSYQISEYIEGKILSSCIKEDFDEQMKKDIYYRIGEITARINSIKIAPNHLYITSRSSWEDYYANKLHERLSLIVKNDFITTEEINKICVNLRSKKANQTLSFTHCDIRPYNMIYNNGDIFVIDAEECEFGDPLNELALINTQWKMWGMFDCVLNGYKSVTDIDLSNDLYFYYQLNDLGLILDMHFNHECKNSWTQLWVDMFNEAKERALQS